MKRIAIALLATAAALAANSARAETRVHLGVNIGVPAPSYRPAPTVVYAPAPAPTVVYAPAPAPRGYWKEVTVKTWVPERWVMSRDYRGRPVRVCEPGHYAFHTDRVWVDSRHDDRRDHDHGPRGHAYGYNNRR